MREYRTKKYLKSLEGNTFNCNEADLMECDGLRVVSIIKELNEDEYDRECIDDTDIDENGHPAYLMNCMYEVKLENGETITVFEDEINPNYQRDYSNETLEDILR